jgi:hypothetical protein
MSLRKQPGDVVTPGVLRRNHVRALIFLVAGLACTSLACSPREPSGNASKTIPIVGDETPLAKVRANTDEYVGKTFVVVGGVQVEDYFFREYKYAKDTHVSFSFSEVRADGSPTAGSMMIYARRSIAGPLVEEISRATSEGSWGKAVRARITIVPERYRGTSDMAELLDWQFLSRDRKSWGPWMNKTSE